MVAFVQEKEWKTREGSYSIALNCGRKEIFFVFQIESEKVHYHHLLWWG